MNQVSFGRFLGSLGWKHLGDDRFAKDNLRIDVDYLGIFFFENGERTHGLAFDNMELNGNRLLLPEPDTGEFTFALYL